MPEKLLHCGRLGPFKVSKEDMPKYFPEAVGMGSRSVAALDKIQDEGIFFTQTQCGFVVLVNGECPNMTGDGCIHGADCLFLKNLVGVKP